MGKIQEIPLESYWNRIPRNLKSPNFFMSLPYLVSARARAYCWNGWYGVMADGWDLFPWFNEGGQVNYQVIKGRKGIWADFEDGDGGVSRELLDVQYVFNPKQFLDMKGGCWETFRKNSRKWPRKNMSWVYYPLFNFNMAKDVWADWLKEKGGIEDSDLLQRYLFNSIRGVFAYGLWDERERLIGINVWDENWKYINYRVSVYRNNESWVGEFLRWLFYTSSTILESGKLVNDGGDLGLPGLKKFKNSMNPLKVSNIYSLIK